MTPEQLVGRAEEVQALEAARARAGARGGPIVETHLGDSFGKVGVSSRVELARAIERSDRVPESAATRPASARRSRPTVAAVSMSGVPASQQVVAARDQPAQPH